MDETRLAEFRKACKIPESVQIYSVSQVTAAVDRALRNVPEFVEIHVIGEVTSFFPRDGNAYLTIKDEAAAIRCFLPRSVKVPFEIQAGKQVLIIGSVNSYGRRSEYEITVHTAFPIGEGMLALGQRELKEKLRKEGLFEAGRKRAVPPFPSCIGVLSSVAGKGYGDALTTIRKRFPNMNVVSCDCFVQGQHGPKSIVAGLKALNGRKDVEVILLVRGGGATEDLSAFNDERVVRAVAKSRIPIVTGIGHDADETICDLVADRRASTPSLAAESTCPDRAELLAALDRAGEALLAAHTAHVEGKGGEAYKRLVEKSVEEAARKDSAIARYRLAILVFLLIIAALAIFALLGGW